MQIHELSLLTNHIDQQRDFYSRVLELPVTRETHEGFALPIGASILVFMPTSQVEALSYHFAFNIPEHQFADAKRWLSSRVPLLTTPSGDDEVYSPNWQAHSIYFSDPDGNIVEFIARHTLPQPQTRPFTTANLSGICEIGMVVEHVPDFVQQIETQLGSPIYQGTIDELFAPVGDEEGLLIVVKRERLWFPELRVAAREAPLKVRLSENLIGPFWLVGPPYHFVPA